MELESHIELRKYVEPILQIDQWKRVNQLELRRDKLYCAVAEKNSKRIESMVVEQISDDDSDVDLTGWRNKGI